MPEQTFKSPGFFEEEIDRSQIIETASGIPVGVVGTANSGPAFVPVTVGSIDQFVGNFGQIDSKKFGAIAAREILRNGSSITFVRVLGGGANSTSGHITSTETRGFVNGAGFRIIGSDVNTDTDKRHKGSVQFIAAKHDILGEENIGYPMFTYNDSIDYSSSGNEAFLIRGMVLLASGTRLQVMDYNENFAHQVDDSTLLDDICRIGETSDSDVGDMKDRFKLVISSSSPSYASSEGFTGIRILTASLNPNDSAYIGNVLNTDPKLFQKEEHLLYSHYPVETEIVKVRGGAKNVAVLSGSNGNSSAVGSSFKHRDTFGRFDARYRNPVTSPFISQPIGGEEYDLFMFETIESGASVNSKYKISISNIKKSDDPENPYGTFTVEVRDFNDNDKSPVILESYPQCDLNPGSENFIGKKIGDARVFYNFDSVDPSERRLTSIGNFLNQSKRIRVILSENLLDGKVNPYALPFGFRGPAMLKTSSTLNDSANGYITGFNFNTSNFGTTGLPPGAIGAVLDFSVPQPAIFLSNAPLPTLINGETRLGGWPTATNLDSRMFNSIVPPLPMRFKITTDKVETSPTYLGQAGALERVNANLYWGVKINSIAPTGSLPESAFSSNDGGSNNGLVENLMKFCGLPKLDSIVTGSGADLFNNNKFSLAKVAFKESYTAGELTSYDTLLSSKLSSDAKSLMKDAAYVRNANLDPVTLHCPDPLDSRNRITLGTVASVTSSVIFNKFTPYMKFTNVFGGGWDGLNILDSDMSEMNDRASSGEAGGKAVASLDIGINSSYVFGVGDSNSTIASYKAAVDILTDENFSNVNVISTPNIRSSALIKHAIKRVEDYGKAIYISDVPMFSSTSTRLYLGDSTQPNARKTAEKFDGLSLNTSYAAAYFPDVTLEDEGGKRIEVPASVAALSAISLSDNISHPWFAPAGFNRGSLSNVTNTKVRLNKAERDDLYDKRINPIASFPNAGHVIFGQKTLQRQRSSLDRVNVRRLLLEVKRIVSDSAAKLVFEQNTPQLRARFVAEVKPQLSVIQSQQGLDQFQVVMDSTNNTAEDIDNNRLNGTIVVVPTKAVEFISIQFIITRSGVEFN